MPSSLRRRLLPAAFAVSLAVVASVVGVALPAQASGSIQVTTTADTDAGVCDSGATTVAPPVSLRDALCAATNAGDTTVVNVPPGAYTLTRGAIEVGSIPGTNVSIVGAGASSVTISGGGTQQVFNLDPILVGGITVSISGVTIVNGAENAFGGGAIIGGSADTPGSADSLTISDSAFVGNRANTASSATNQPGGAVQFIGGSLTIDRTVFRNNSSGTSSGGAVYYQSGTGGLQRLAISNSTFQGNTAVAGAAGATGGSAVAVAGSASAASMSITDSVFDANTATGSGSFHGSGVWLNGGALSLTGSSFTGNTATSGSASAIEVSSGSLTGRYNRINGNAAPAVRLSSGSADLSRTWWGCGGTPGSPGCDTVSGGVTVSPQLTLTGAAAPSVVTLPGSSSSTLTATLRDSGGTAVPAGSLAAFQNLTVAWSTLRGTVTPATASLATGSASTVFTASAAGPATVTAALDQARPVIALQVDAPPAITSAATVAGSLGVASSFVVTTTGYPAPALTATGALPTGVTFLDNGNGTATISGTPTGQAKDYPITVTATNGVGSPAQQTLTYAMNAAPAFTSAATATFTTQTPGSFRVTTSGRPVSTIVRSGSLPNGLTFTDNGDGTATIAGTPTLGTGGRGTINLTATNSQGTTTQTLTLTVLQQPAFTSGSVVTTRVGTAFSVPITTSGYPAPTITLTGSLPSGVTFVDNGDGTGSLSGTPTGPGGTSTVTLTATGAGAPVSSTLTVNVYVAPAVTLNPADQTVTDASGVSFTAVATGFPAPTVQWQRSSNGGASYTNIAGATSATYTFTAALSNDGYLYRAVFSNQAGAATTTAATLAVGTAPGFTSPAAATVAAGDALTFAVTTTGHPAATLSATGLPAWLSFTDLGDGTGELSGTAPQGSGGAYPIVVTASNGFQPESQQNLVLTVTESPVITSAPSGVLTAGASGSIVVTTAGGWPANAAISRTSGVLPTGVILVDRADGTAVLSGTPAAGTGGTYPITLTASNGVSPATTQAFVLTVNEAPVLSVAADASATVGSPFSLPVTVLRGFPTATLSVSPALPAGLTFTDNGDGTGAFSGTPTGPGGAAVVTVTAENGVGTGASQAVALTIRQAPAITTAAAPQSVTAGQVATFTATASGYPAPAVQWSVSVAGGAFAPIEGETGTTLAFPASLDDAGNVYRATFTNATGSVSTQAALAVGTAPAFTSAARAVFAAGGGAQTFTVRTTSTPTAAIAAAGLPAWATLTDLGDGTAILAANPPAGAAGDYPVALTAANGYQPGGTQALVLVVTQAPVLTSPASAVFAVGAAGSFTITTSAGWPAATTLAVTGPLPDGLTFHDNGDGTATLAGTASAGTGGVHALTISATNGAASASQAFSLTVTEATSFTSPATLPVTRGVAVDATITTAHAFPAVSGVSVTGSLPAGLTFVPGADGTAALSGSTVVPAGSYPVTLIASAPGVPDVTQQLTLVVADADVLPLPPIPPTADGTLSGVPAAPVAGQTMTLVATGFAPASPVTFGIYSSPVVLAVVEADAQGTATATVVIPAGYTGSHTLLAIGTAPDGTVRELRSAIVLPRAAAKPGAQTAAPGGLAATGLDVSALAVLASLLLAAGIALAVRRRVRRA